MLGWSHRDKNYTVVIKIWSIDCYEIFISQMTVDFLLFTYFFFTAKNVIGLNCLYEWHAGFPIRNGNCLSFPSTWGHLRIFYGVHVPHLFVLFSVLYFLLVCLRPVSCVPDSVSVAGFSILDCPFGFL
jgi:hypothetical protein